MTALTAIFRKRGVTPTPSEDGRWVPGFILLLAEGEDAPFVTQDGKPAADLLPILKRSGWAFHAYDEDLFFLAPGDVAKPRLDADQDASEEPISKPSGPASG
jgi:hypothetical protein